MSYYYHYNQHQVKSCFAQTLSSEFTNKTLDDYIQKERGGARVTL